MKSLGIIGLLERYGSSILRRCAAIVGPDDAEDAAQEVFLIVMRKGEQFRGEADPGTWLYRVTTNHCLNRLRADNRREAREQADGVHDWMAKPSHDPYAQYEAKVWLETVMEGLEPLAQQILIYRYLDGLTQEEIATVTGKSRRTIGKKLKHIEAQVQRAREQSDQEQSL